MKKVYKLENLDCANCAAKMESKIKKLKGVDDAKISFMAQRMTIETNEAFSIDEVIRVCKKVEPDCTILI